MLAGVLLTVAVGVVPDIIAKIDRLIKPEINRVVAAAIVVRRVGVAVVERLLPGSQNDRAADHAAGRGCAVVIAVVIGIDLIIQPQTAARTAKCARIRAARTENIPRIPIAARNYDAVIAGRQIQKFIDAVGVGGIIRNCVAGNIQRDRPRAAVPPFQLHGHAWNAEFGGILEPVRVAVEPDVVADADRMENA
ncbi:hypothetical protein U14_03181 [Candidatus Moduliflexus flocculans]|uniref:Uncharacterized protein n=1 Tax=Candidatus Moduliflexus flocculans TaxID=1499966 RepID=A0A081BNG9_9BACT|nr:hypothetical protein U14_03181 [Candidatus Moduliflexus flocculans]